MASDQRQQPNLDPKNTKVEDGQRQQPTVEPKVTALCRRQKAMIASLYRTLQQPMEHTAVELIRNLWTQIQDVHFRLYEEVEIPEENGYDIKEYLKAERDVQGALAAKSPSECTNDRNLPRITIPKFDGDILKWTQFFDMFVSMVHETNMPTIRKMWYLKTSVVGEAERMIRQIDLKEDNYLHAWNILVDTYDNPRDIATTVLNRFLNQQAINDNTRGIGWEMFAGKDTLPNYNLTAAKYAGVWDSSMKPGSGTGYPPWCSAGQPNYNKRNYRVTGIPPGLCHG
ncbi:hypothetical protein ACLKA6_012328 [Drosophila palustris]